LTGELKCAVTFHVLLEFIHVTTDPKRFKSPLTLKEGLGMVEQYWNASNWNRLLPHSNTGSRMLDLLRRYRLGRRRLLDTYLAATLLDNQVTTLITCDWQDFEIFEELRLINPLGN
jgi:predicted nucleic acid-binding protein